MSWSSEPIRLVLLITLCTLLWSLESVVPLYNFKNGRLRHALPNVALTLILLLTNLALSFSSALTAEFAIRNGVGVLPLIGLSPVAALLLGVAGLDLFTYFAHVLLHKSWLGWQFHRVHHSENAMDVTTAFRQHPGETVWRIGWQLAAILFFGLPLWVVIVYLTLSSLNALMEHANIKLPDRVDWLLRLLIVTPNMHKVHHSRLQIQTDSNYANIFSVWDRIFGTYTARVNFRELQYGLDGFDDSEKQRLIGLLRMPFVV
jgi:sterol desaturase/sphingolipid hydroxylase (fatty acid hydroxylase superfamily)